MWRVLVFPKGSQSQALYDADFAGTAVVFLSNRTCKWSVMTLCYRIKPSFHVSHSYKALNLGANYVLWVLLQIGSLVLTIPFFIYTTWEVLVHLPIKANTLFKTESSSTTELTVFFGSTYLNTVSNRKYMFLSSGTKGEFWLTDLSSCSISPESVLPIHFSTFPDATCMSLFSTELTESTGLPPCCT